MSKVRVGVVGMGFGQQVHVPVFRSVADCEVVAVCARTLDKARAVAQRLNVERAFEGWRSLIEDDSIDAVAIAVPPSVQPEIAVSAMASGKAVFCEKPLATSLDGAAQMVNAAQRTRLANAVDFEFPETPAWQAAKDILRNSGIGELRHFAVHWNVETYAVKMGLDSWKLRSAEGGGVLFSFVSHVFYNLEWLVGPVRTVTCQFPRFQSEGETYVAVTTELESGAVGSISVSSDAFLGGGQRWEFYGKRGTLVLSNSTPDYINGFQVQQATRSSDRMEEIALGTLCSPAADGRVSAVTPIAGRFIEWVRGGPPSHPDWNAGLRVQQLLDAALRSQATGQRIHCP